MYIEHPTFIPPDDPNVKIWRYIDFNKFVSILDTGSLWFTRADQFSDQFEGSSPKMNISSRKATPDISKADIPIFNNLIENTSQVKRQWLKYVAINCWHMNEGESTAMWGLYLKSNEGLAIQSTFNRLKKSLSKTDEKVYIGKVKYIDYEHQVIEDANILSPFVHKRKNFEHERELRALVVKSPPPGPRGLNFSVETIRGGILVSADLTILIENIYTAPEAPAWLIKLIESIIKKYGYNFLVLPSPMVDSKPQY